MYELINASRQYGGGGGNRVIAIDSLDVAIGQGAFVVVAGPSGSGKSTLLQLLGGLDRPTSGSVVFEGLELDRLADEKLAWLRRDTFGFVFQQFNLIPTLTAAENVEAALAPGGGGSSERRERVTRVLEHVGLAARAGHLPSQLSGGEQQRVAIARALANEPRVLLADEPTGNLDRRTGEGILALLYSLWESTGLTVVLVTHDEAIAEAAPRVIRLEDGRLDEPVEPLSSLLKPRREPS
jgi:putative ABC transport system ATP-binding protein